MASSSSALRSSQRSERQHIPHGRSASSALSRSVDGQQTNLSVRPKPPASRRSVTPNSRTRSHDDDDPEPGRVRVAVRLRPRNAEDLLSDADFADCVEIQPELNRLKLKKNNWNSESYRFDEVFSESASQRRVYEVVAKPVVESVLNGYNGTVMAYGQTGTGKTYTLGRLGKDDASERGIMVRAMEDILANASPVSDNIEVSYLQLYLEYIQDLLAPEKINIPIVEDPKTGEVTLPGAVVVKIRDLDHFFQLLQTVGLEKILQLLISGDIDVQIHARKVVANLAAEDINREKIVEEGGLDALLMLLQSSQNTTILRVASGAIANLAMNEANQSLIMNKGGARLLANTTSKTDDPQTLRMVDGAIANLCGNELFVSQWRSYM